MLRTLLFCCVMSPIFGFAQHLSFTYDTAGNQTKRELTFSSGRSAAPAHADTTAVTLQKFFPEDEISYYPNPVKQALYLQWEHKEGHQLSTITVFSMNGQQLLVYDNRKKSQQATLDFQAYPQGVYNVILNYADGEKKAIKIIKQ